MGLTIENCAVGILVDAGVRVVFEELMVRKCGTGMYVSTQATAAFLAINRCNFTQSGSAIVLHSANATLRVKKTCMYDIGRSFKKNVSVENSATFRGEFHHWRNQRVSSTTGNYRRLKNRKMLKRMQSQSAMKFSLAEIDQKNVETFTATMVRISSSSSNMIS